MASPSMATAAREIEINANDVDADARMRCSLQFLTFNICDVIYIAFDTLKQKIIIIVSIS